MAVAYKSQGAGVATETSGAALSPACPAVVDAGDILIAHVFWEGTLTAPSTPAGWTLLDGPRVIESTIARHWIFGKVAAGTEDGAAVAFGNPAVTTQRGARIYSFSGRVSGTIAELVTGFAATSHATDPQMPTVQTTVAGALAVACVAQNDNNTAGNATGESGGDWVEAVAEFTAALTPGLMLQVQTCTPTGDPGTVSGGAVATTNDPCGVIGFQIKPQATAPTMGRISLAELEAPFVATRGRVSFAELETPLVPTRGRIAWAELEAPLAPTRGRTSWVELEAPSLPGNPTRGQIGFAELEVPLQATRGRIAWAEIEAPLAPTRARISWSELEAPLAPTRGRASLAELEVGTAPTRGLISWAEFALEDVAPVDDHNHVACAYRELQRARQGLRQT